MRTTVRIDDRLLVEAKRRAAMSGRTLNELIEDALREAFARREGGRHRVELTGADG
jgi:predicted HicB family RNase H-like nuclease